ncbi:DUF3631 domain-containing protein [Mycobacterium sp. NPDC050853]|uniref:DUF3631 domain-containing protein n=1 Tax=Mycobacterium sp. NPDC050853 TaxID=3155160 RepID=UPI0033F22C14
MIFTETSFPDLLQILGYAPDEHVAVCTDASGVFASSVITADQAPGLTPDDDANYWFSVNPVTGPVRRNKGRGSAPDVTRLAAVWADIDIKDGACRDFDQAHVVINALSGLLGSRPSAIVSSGHGLQPYWPIEDGQIVDNETRAQAARLLLRFGRLVHAVARGQGVKLDSVFDLPRVMRLPGTRNCKREPVPVTYTVDTGGPLSLEELDERLTEAGIFEVDDDTRVGASTAAEISAPAEWTYTDNPCSYAIKTIEGWKVDNPSGRHPWLVAQATRIAVMHRLGCLTSDLHQYALATLQAEFVRLCGRSGDTRPVPPHEFSDAVEFGQWRASSMSAQQVATETGRHVEKGLHINLMGKYQVVAPPPFVIRDADDTDVTDKSVDRGEVDMGASDTDVTDVTDKSEDGGELLNEVETYLSRFISFPSRHARIAYVLWIVHTHLMDEWESTPRILFVSPEPGSGKTRALEVAEPLVPRAVHAVNCTPAYLFRKVSDPAGAPTVFYDEIDTVFGPKAKDNEDIRGMLNAGHRKGAVAGRCVIRGKTVETEEIPAYCAVALAGLNDLPDTIMTRSVIVRMRRRKPDEKVEPWRARINRPEGEALFTRLQQWTTAHRQTARETWPDMPEGVEDRDADIWEPLLAVADLAGGDWPAAARGSAVAMVAASKARTPSMGVRLLRDVRSVYGKDTMLSTTQLLGELNRLEESPWGVSQKGMPLDPRGIAAILRDYGIESKQLRDVRGGRFRGYVKGQFSDAWTRYLTDEEAVDVFEEAA